MQPIPFSDIHSQRLAYHAWFILVCSFFRKLLANRFSFDFLRPFELHVHVSACRWREGLNERNSSSLLFLFFLSTCIFYWKTNKVGVWKRIDCFLTQMRETLFFLWIGGRLVCRSDWHDWESIFLGMYLTTNAFFGKICLFQINLNSQTNKFEIINK